MHTTPTARAFLLSWLACVPALAQGDVVVTVQDPQGQPIPDAQVCLFPPDTPPAPGSAQGTGGRDGAATFTDVPAGSHWLIVSRSGSIGKALEIEVGAGGAAESVTLLGGDPSKGPLCRRPPEIVEMTINNGADVVPALTLPTFHWRTSATLLAPMEYRIGDLTAMSSLPWMPAPVNEGTPAQPHYGAATLVGGDPGEHTYAVQVRYLDDPDLVAQPFPVTIELGGPAVADLPPAAIPEVHAFQINSGLPATSQPMVWLTWYTPQTGLEPMEYRVSEDPSFAGVAWSGAPAPTGNVLYYWYFASFHLDPAPPNALHLQMRYSGEPDPQKWGNGEDSIEFVPLTALPPILIATDFSIDDGAETTDSRDVTLRWSTGPGDLEYRVSEAGPFDSCVGLGWKDSPASQEDDYTLQLGPAGERTVFFQIRFRDNAQTCTSSQSDSIELQTETYEIGGAHAVAFAWANGWGMDATEPPIGPHQIECAIEDAGGSGDPAQLGTFNWSPAPFTCQFDLFDDYNLNDGWTYQGFSGGTAACDSGEVAVFPPDPGDTSPKFDIELTAPMATGFHPGYTLLHTRCIYELESLTLEGPADTDWENAFIRFAND